MLLWILLNVALPLMPLSLVGLLSWLLGWKKNVLDIIGDGQLYFFSAAVCGVFTFDALKAARLDTTYYSIVLFTVILLICFYTAAMFITHSGIYFGGNPDGGAVRRSASRKLAYVSVLLTLATLAGVCYGRFTLGLI